MITPNSLKKGDTVIIISTARKICKEEVLCAVKSLESWGLKVILGDNLFNKHEQYAGSDADRALDLQNALNNSEIKAIICARGGYGTVRIIDGIDYSKFITSPKWICGYSDVTAIHSHVQKNFEIETLHSTMPINFESNTTLALNSLKDALFGNTISYSFEPHKLNKIGHCTGEVIGGNLSIIHSLLGSQSALESKGKILFLEDLDEYLYHIDRMMMNLKRNGILSNLSGLVIGGMTDMNDNTIPFGKTAVEIIYEHASAFDFPIAFEFPAGHINDNRTIILGRKAQLEITDRHCSLSFNA